MAGTQGPEFLQSRVLVAGVQATRCLRWHADRLWFLDGQALCTADLHGRTAVALASTVGSAFCFGPGGELFPVDMQRGDLYRQDPDGPHRLARVYPFGGLFDLVAHPSGRLYIIGRGFDHPLLVPRSGNLFLVSPEGAVQTVIEDSLGLPTGIDVTPDGGTLFVAEDQAPRLTTYTIRPDGRPVQQRTFAAPWSRQVHVSRLCVDAAGGAWVTTWWNASLGSPAIVPAYECVRLVAGGFVTHRIPMPGKWVHTCVLGGPNHHTLFLGTSAAGATEDTRYGFIEAISLDIPGAGWS